jgi:uncharacterized repeat protein (TIGR01451 family)
MRFLLPSLRGALCAAVLCCALCVRSEATTVTLQRGLGGTVEDTCVENGLGAAGALPLLRIYSGSTRNLGPKILLRFTLPSLSSTTTITRADLQLYLVTGATSEMFALYPVTRPWTESGATWTSCDATHSWAAPGLAGGADYAAGPVAQAAPATNGWATWDLHSWLQEEVHQGRFASGGAVSLMLSNTGEVNVRSEFHASEASEAGLRPKLTIDFVRDAPVADAGPDLFMTDVVPGSTRVELDGSRSRSLVSPRFHWSFDTVPDGSRLAASNLTPNDTGSPQSTFVPDRLGHYVARLRITNANGTTSDATVNVDCWHARTARPRILISAAELTKLGEKRGVDPAGFASLAAAAGATLWESTEELGTSCIAKAMLYRTDPSAYAGQRQAAVDFLLGTAGRGYTDGRLMPFRSDGTPAITPNNYGPGGDPNLARPRLLWAAIAYDCVADWLTLDQLSRAVRWLVAQATECQSGGGEAGEIDNYFYRAMSAVGIAGLALLDDDPSQARQLLQWAEERWRRYRMALEWPSSQPGSPPEGMGGFLPEGTYYSLNGWYIPLYLLGVQNALGDSRWEGLPHYAERMVNMLMEYHPGFIGYGQLGAKDNTRPIRNPIAVGDAIRNQHGYQFYRRWEEALLVKVYGGSPDAGRRTRAQQLNWWLHLWPVNHIWHNNYAAMEYLLAEPTLPTRKPDVLAWNTGLGHVFLRSKWGNAARPDEPPDITAHAADENATHIYYHAGPLLTGHEHLDQGSFQIWKRGDLAIDSGIYDDNVLSDHELNYSKRTVAHNSVLILQPGESWTQAFTAGTSAQTNDGGQRSKRPTSWGMSLAERKSHPERFDTGRILQFEDTASFAYIDSDITQSYNTGQFSSQGNRPKADRVTRQLVYLRPQDAARAGTEFVLLYDRVTARDGSFRKKWLLHFLGTNGGQSEPQVLRDATGSPATGQVVTPETEIVYTDASVVRCDAPDRRDPNRITAGDGDGRLVLQTLLPVQHTIRKIGRFPKATLLERQSDAGQLDTNAIRLVRANRTVENGAGTRFHVAGDWTVTFTGPRACTILGPAPGPGEAQIRTDTTLDGFDSAGVAYAFELPASAWSGTFRAGDRFRFRVDPGKATWVDDPNGESDSHEAINSHEPKYGEWRVEIEPPAGNVTDYFLNVLYPTVNRDGTIPPAHTVTTSSAEMLGAQVSNRLVLFGRDGLIDKTVSYMSGGLPSPTLHLLVDMRPSSVYTVTVNGAAQQVTADAHGVLSFETTPRDVSVTVGQTVDQSPSPPPPTGTSHLVITLSGTPAAARMGQTVTYTVQFANRGDAEAPDAVLRVPLAAELILVANSIRLNGQPVSGATQAGGELRIPVGRVAPGAGGTVTFQVRTARPAGTRAVRKASGTPGSNHAATKKIRRPIRR